MATENNTEKQHKIHAIMVNTLDQWKDVQSLAQDFLNSRFAPRIGFTQKSLETYFILSLSRPDVFGMILGYLDDVPNCIVVVQELSRLDKDAIWEKFGHIVGAYNVQLPGIHNSVEQEVADSCMSMVDLWCKERGHRYVQAYTRKEAKIQAFESRFGLKAIQWILQKDY